MPYEDSAEAAAVEMVAVDLGHGKALSMVGEGFFGTANMARCAVGLQAVAGGLERKTRFPSGLRGARS